MTEDEWADWQAGSEERLRRLFELMERKKAQIERERENSERGKRRRRRLFGLL